MSFGSGKTISFFVAILLFASICAAETITQTYGVFDVTFYNSGDTDGAKTGEQDWTSQQMSDVASAASEWQSHISNTAGRQIQVHMFWGEMDSLGTGVLGGSASYRIGNGSQIWNMGEYVWKEGLDPGLASTGFDTIIQYDTTAAGLSWNFGSTTPTSGTIDFRSIITHELGHSLGWDSTYDSDPRYDDWGWMYVNGTQGNYYGLSAWDENLVDSAGNRAISGGKGTPSNFDQTDNPVFFDGANAVALYGDLIPIYAPTTYNSGSSLVHLDESGLGDLLMSPFVSSGQMIRTVSELEWAMMEDMGWSIVPEPSSIILMLTAFGFIRRKRK